MDREQVRLYKKKQRDQARMISDLELQKEATAEEERLNIRTQSIERIVQREKSHDRLSRTPPSQKSPISQTEANEKIDETADFQYKKITVPTLDIDSMKSGSVIMDETDEKESSVSIQQRSPRPNIKPYSASTAKTEKSKTHKKTTSLKVKTDTASKPRKSAAMTLTPLRTATGLKIKQKPLGVMKKGSATSKK